MPKKPKPSTPSRSVQRRIAAQKGLPAPEFDCRHDYANPSRKGRAHYVCPKCGEDISMALVLMRELEMRKQPKRKRSAKSKVWCSGMKPFIVKPGFLNVGYDIIDKNGLSIGTINKEIYARMIVQALNGEGK